MKEPDLKPDAAQVDQIFAADRPHRARAVKVGASVGGLLVAAWLVALAFGALGGLNPFPALHIGRTGPATETPAIQLAPTSEQVPPAATGGSAKQGGAGPSSAGAGAAPGSTPGSSPAAAAAKPGSVSAGTSPSGTTTTTVAPHGKPAGAGPADGTGKPSGTPGKGSSGSQSSGSQGALHGNAYGTTKKKS